MASDNNANLLVVVVGTPDAAPGPPSLQHPIRPFPDEVYFWTETGQFDGIVLLQKPVKYFGHDFGLRLYIE